ncbi:TPA: hypothetical protein ACH3X3_011529 [Trebouxia sp. C0006]
MAFSRLLHCVAWRPPRLDLQECHRHQHQTGWRALNALSTGQARITFLSLWGMPSEEAMSHWKRLKSMPYLTTLVIDKPMRFTGALVLKQPRLSTLYLVNCNDITDKGVANIVDMFPALHTVLLCKEVTNSSVSHSRRVALHSRMVAQQCMVRTFHSSLLADSTSTNGLSVQLATVVSRSSGLQVMCHV